MPTSPRPAADAEPSAHSLARSGALAWLVLLGFLAAAFAAAALGGIATASSVKTWYLTLAKPAWNPPAWLFGPVWSLLYTAMSVAIWRVWRRPVSPERTSLLRRWWLQLALNAAWSWAFFYFRNPAGGLAIIGLLLGLIAIMQPRFARVDRPAALLWTPYVLWVAFASALNLAIWHLN
jgi:translocator protein